MTYPPVATTWTNRVSAESAGGFVSLTQEGASLAYFQCNMCSMSAE